MFSHFLLSLVHEPQLAISEILVVSNLFVGFNRMDHLYITDLGRMPDSVLAAWLDEAECNACFVRFMHFMTANSSGEC